ncbi:hypothetical protein CC80DRAFT_250631 [Byssothecium circinans]|uniref:Secreted protein n=1 Tax=Byssothecium circinans TaxID=147558 RepID=A0A6A5TDV9_9PLEO|nr:hypothetical protein CC80DRAFT_250631 [Byssothecium circinans]
MFSHHGKGARSGPACGNTARFFFLALLGSARAVTSLRRRPQQQYHGPQAFIHVIWGSRRHLRDWHGNMGSSGRLRLLLLAFGVYLCSQPPCYIARTRTTSIYFQQHIPSTRAITRKNRQRAFIHLIWCSGRHTRDRHGDMASSGSLGLLLLVFGIY